MLPGLHRLTSRAWTPPLVRLFDWGTAADHKVIVRLFQRFDQADSSRLQSSSFRWLFDKLRLNSITLTVDSAVLTRWGTQIEGAPKAIDPKHHARASHHPLLAIVADWRLIANFWLRPGNTNASNNALSALEPMLENLGATKVGLFRADSGFYDKSLVDFLACKKITHIISARLTQLLQQTIVDQCKWQQVKPGLEFGEVSYQPNGWSNPQRLVVVRQHVRRNNGVAPEKNAVAVYR